MGYIDSHAHLNSERFSEDLDDVIKRAISAGVSRILNVADTIQSSEEAIALSKKYENILCAVGIHPHNSESVNENHYSLLEKLVESCPVAAIGEIGLDYHYQFSPRETQKRVFAEQIRIAGRSGLPVIIHNRESSEDVLKILVKNKTDQLRGVFHCFSGDIDLAKKAIKSGFYISFSGTLTFPKSENLRKIAEALPLDKLLVETDAPYLAPQKFRGKRNEPAHVIEVTKTLSVIRCIPEEELMQQIESNFNNLFLQNLR
jgi:TatD DNase family protein